MTSGKDLPFSENNNWAFSFRGICVEYGEDVWAPGLGAQEVVHEMRGDTTLQFLYILHMEAHNTLNHFPNSKWKRNEKLTVL